LMLSLSMSIGVGRQLAPTSMFRLGRRNG
jgi:hypothetical protein